MYSAVGMVICDVNGVQALVSPRTFSNQYKKQGSNYDDDYICSEHVICAVHSIEILEELH